MKSYHPESGVHAVVSLERLPACIKQATLAAEDENFYTEFRFGLRGILRAFWIDLQSGETLAGGSTTHSRWRVACCCQAKATSVPCG